MRHYNYDPLKVYLLVVMFVSFCISAIAFFKMIMLHSDDEREFNELNNYINNKTKTNEKSCLQSDERELN
jgi:hypothetical protein